jgi:tetratricopeptide (TPR) repeat protein
MWLKRVFKKVRARPRDLAPSAQERRVTELLYQEGAYDSAGELLSRVLEGLPVEEELEAGTLRALIAHLGGHHGEAGARLAAEQGDILWFWKTLADRSGSPHALACYADALLAGGRERAEEAVDCFLAAFDRRPELLGEFGDDLHDLARELGGARWLRTQLAGLRAAVADGGEGEDVREIYCELLEEYHADQAALTAIRAVGRQIDDAVAAGQLPRALVRRGSWRARGKAP